MIPALADKISDLKLRQQEMYDSLSNYQERDELSHLRFDFSFDDIFIEFLNHQKLLDFDIDVNLLRDIEQGKHFNGASLDVQKHQELLAKYYEINQMKPAESGLDIEKFTETQKEFLLFLQDRYAPKTVDRDEYQNMIYKEIESPKVRYSAQLHKYEIFEDEWREIMNNMDIYANFYFSNLEFRNRFDERLKAGKIRGWTKEGQINLEKLKQKFKEFKDP